MNVFNPNSGKIGGYSETDGTIDFYSRINCLINQESIVLDFGAGEVYGLKINVNIGKIQDYLRIK